MHLWSSILDYTACVYDAAEILFRTDGRTNKAILGVWYKYTNIDACICDAYICYPVWCIYLCSSILDYDARVYDAHIHDPGPWSWNMCVCCMYGTCVYDVCVCMMQMFLDLHIYFMHVCMMHIHMFLDHYAYVLDALVYDAYICDPWYLSMLHVCMMRQILSRTNGRTNGQGDSRSRIDFDSEIGLWKDWTEWWRVLVWKIDSWDPIIKGFLNFPPQIFK